MILDLGSYWPDFKEIANFKHNCYKNSIRLTGQEPRDQTQIAVISLILSEIKGNMYKLQIGKV